MKKLICNILNHPQFMGVFIVFSSIVILSMALISQYGFGLHPCVLCIYQRIPYVFAIAFGTLTYAVHKISVKMMLFFLAAAIVALFIDSAIAVFHVGVEHKWWEGTTSCGQSLPQEGDLEALRAALFAAPIVRCDAVAWSLFGISMAGYNALVAAFLGSIASKTFLSFVNKKV